MRTGPYYQVKEKGRKRHMRKKAGNQYSGSMKTFLNQWRGAHGH